MKAEAIQSMSRNGDCYDNALMESFFSSLKKERIHRRKYWTRKESSRLNILGPALVRDVLFVRDQPNDKERHSHVLCQQQDMVVAIPNQPKNRDDD